MPDTAQAQLERVLYILAAAALPEGADEAELSAALGISPGQAARDLTALADRAYYQPPGSSGAADILVEEGRIRLVTRGGVHRPARLDAGEAAALALGLRSMALECGGERRARLLALCGRMERFAARAASGAALAADADLPGSGQVREAVRRAAAERRACRIEYLKADGSASVRVVFPYALVHAERWWYLLGKDGERGERLFRMDRIMEATVLEEHFEVPQDFDASRHLAHGRAFTPPEGAIEVTVRYGAAAAAWVREKWQVAAEESDGSVIVRHAVADPGWVVAHVLQYGPDAELLHPPHLRDAVRRRLQASLAAWSSA